MPSLLSQPPSHVGEKIRALRFEQRLTQTALASRADINTATVSLIESGKRPGTVEVHRRLARALGLTLSALYAGLDEARKDAVAFQPEPTTREVYAHPGLGFTLQPLTTNMLEKRMMPVRLRLEAGGSTVVEQARAGSQTEKFVYVQAGTIEVRVAEECFPLRQHQTLYFDATLPHQLRNVGREPAEVFLVVTPPML